MSDPVQVITVQPAGETAVTVDLGAPTAAIDVIALGTPGPAGPTGPTGPAGPTGPTGPQGPIGDPSSPQTIATVSATTYTLVPADAGSFIRFTSSPGCSITLPSSIAAGVSVDCVGVGPLTFLLGPGANWSVLPPSTMSRGQGYQVTAIKMGSSTWCIYGGL